MTFLDCPAYTDDDQSPRCALPAEVVRRFFAESTDGPIECVMIRCPADHWFSAPVEFLTCHSTIGGHPVAAAVTSCAGRLEHNGNDAGRDNHHGFAIPASTGAIEHDVGRSSCAPAYYLGRPAWLWIAALRRRPARSASARSGGHDSISAKPVPRAAAALDPAVR